MKKLLVCCEESQRVCIEFRAKGWEAYSCDIIECSGAELKGCGIVIEKGFQTGGDELRSRGIRVESLAKIASLDENGITFCR